MYLASDNSVGASEKILSRLMEIMRQGPLPSYGYDDLTKAVEREIEKIFEHEAKVFFLLSGTASNALALAQITPPWGAVFAHERAHILASECGATWFYSGARATGIPGDDGKILPEDLKDAVELCLRTPHCIKPASLSLTNLTEVGTLYTIEETKALTAIAKDYGLKTHLDGARFANAVATLKCKPADLSWRAGIDVLSLGATKNGAIAAEAVIFFDPKLAKDFEHRQLRGGHLISKHRFLAAQFLAWFEGGHWLELAQQANKIAARLASGLQKEGIKLAFPCQGNQIFPFIPLALQEKLRKAGAVFHPWRRGFRAGEIPAQEEELSRLVCAFSTTESEVDAFLDLVKRAKN